MSYRINDLNQACSADNPEFSFVFTCVMNDRASSHCHFFSTLQTFKLIWRWSEKHKRTFSVVAWIHVNLIKIPHQTCKLGKDQSYKKSERLYDLTPPPIHIHKYNILGYYEHSRYSFVPHHQNLEVRFRRFQSIGQWQLWGWYNHIITYKTHILILV